MFYERIVKRINFKSGSFIAIYPVYYGPHTIFVFVAAFYISWKWLLKTIYDTAPAVISIWINKTKHTEDCTRTVYMDFSLKGCQIYSVPFNIIIIKSEVWIVNHCLGLGHETMVCAVCLNMFLWPWYWISNMATHALLLHIWYKTTPISWNSTGNILMIYDWNETVISNPRTTFSDLFPWWS